MKLDEYLKALDRGTAKKLAEAVGVPPSNVSMWKTGKQKPSPEKCKLIEKFTLGVVSRKELRPEIFD